MLSLLRVAIKDGSPTSALNVPSQFTNSFITYPYYISYDVLQPSCRRKRPPGKAFKR
jgi:hypothetical protein